VATLLKVAPDELVTIKGANFGAIKPKLNTDIASLEINFGTTQCFQTVTFWNATSITLQMCAKASNTNLPIHITLGNKTSPPFTTLVKVKAAVKCDPGRDLLLSPTAILSASTLTSLSSFQRFVQQRQRYLLALPPRKSWRSATRSSHNVPALPSR
jgi:hypothetical protein